MFEIFKAQCILFRLQIILYHESLRGVLLSHLQFSDIIILDTLQLGALICGTIVDSKSSYFPVRRNLCLAFISFLILGNLNHTQLSIIFNIFQSVAALHLFRTFAHLLYSLLHSSVRAALLTNIIIFSHLATPSFGTFISC